MKISLPHTPSFAIVLFHRTESCAEVKEKQLLAGAE
jgi:hypothetical protein